MNKNLMHYQLTIGTIDWTRTSSHLGNSQVANQLAFYSINWWRNIKDAERVLTEYGSFELFSP